MRVFVTGATGFVGSAVVGELLAAGHRVLGLARSDKAAASLSAAGADVHRGSLEDFDSLRTGAAATDAVIHAGFIHDFSNYAACVEVDKCAIETLGAALTGSDRPLIVTSGTLVVQREGPSATEEDASDPNFPRKSEQVALAAAQRGARVSIVRLPPSVHGDGDHGFLPAIIGMACEKGVSAYVGDGLNRWPAVHRLDAARLYRLVLEKGSAGATYHGVGDQGVPFREIAEVIGRHLDIPLASKSGDDAAQHFAWMTHFVTMDSPASSAQTQQQLGWRATQPGLIADLENGSYFNALSELKSA